MGFQYKHGGIGLIELQKVRLEDICKFQNGYAFKSKDFISDGQYNVVKIKELKNGKVKFFEDTATIDLNIDEYENYSIVKGDVLFALTGDPVNKNNPLSWVGRVAIYKEENVSLLNQRVCKVITEEDKILKEYVYYYFRVFENFYSLAAKATGSASQANISTKTIADTEMMIPSIETQKKIVKLLSAFDDKIDNNNHINDNLEQQLQTIFIKMFGADIDKMPNGQYAPLGELVISVDNRGKTPPLAIQETEFPIIDVRALSGTSRIVDYNNCTKYVEYETYKNWFRSGHPQPFDILISTVGSLAEMRVFLGSKGCVAQNVVAFRSKGVSPLYLYQYLSFIKNDLVAYNIGSVQPSIKVTHIIKHLVYIPDNERINKFDAFAVAMTNQIYQNCQENEYLIKLRDVLLLKLMSGELDISEID